MRRKHHRAKATRSTSYQIRLSVIAGGAIFLMALVTVRLFVKSVTLHAETVEQAEQQYVVRKAIEPIRGTIYLTDASVVQGSNDTENDAWQPVATNRLTYALSVVPRNILDVHAVAEALTRWVEMPASELAEKIDGDGLYLAPLKTGLTKEDKDTILALKLQGVFLTEEPERYYPDGQLAAHIVGFVNAEDQGNYGIEQMYQEKLEGSGGEVTAERDVVGRLLSMFDTEPVEDGSHVVLTIDRNVQAFVEETLKQALATYQADSGTIVVMDAQTGGIVAMASAPTFNPNNYNDEDQAKFLNPAISAVWEPGSIFKTVVMAAGLDHGVIEPETEDVFSNSVVVDGFTIHTAEDKAFGRETMTQVLENSDNVAMVWLADKLGNDRLGETLEKFRFGEETGIDLPGEVGGYLSNFSKWRNTNRATISFGQGVSVTPLQLTAALAALGNGGKLFQPHVVSTIIAPDGAVTDIQPTLLDDQVISAETSAKIAGMMVSVVENGHGKRARVPGYKIAGKTGTAQIPRPAEEGGGYYEDQHIGGFGGFFPANSPRFAMVVKLDRPKTVKFAESSAAPTFGEIARFMLNYYRIPPTEPINQPTP